MLEELQEAIALMVGLTLVVCCAASAGCWFALEKVLGTRPVLRSGIAATVPPILLTAFLFQTDDTGLLTMTALPITTWLCAIPVYLLQRRASRRGGMRY